MCPFRKVSKTVGQKTVWQLFNTIEYEVWQWAKDEDQEEYAAWASNKPAKKLQRWANNEKHTHISIFRLSALQHTRKLPTHLHPFHVLAVAIAGAGAAVAFGIGVAAADVAVVVAQLLPPGNFSVIKYLNLIKATNEQPDSEPVPQGR